MPNSKRTAVQVRWYILPKRNSKTIRIIICLWTQHVRVCRWTLQMVYFCLVRSLGLGICQHCFIHNYRTNFLFHSWWKAIMFVWYYPWWRHLNDRRLDIICLFYMEKLISFQSVKSFGRDLYYINLSSYLIKLLLANADMEFGT